LSRECIPPSAQRNRALRLGLLALLLLLAVGAFVWQRASGGPPPFRPAELDRAPQTVWQVSGRDDIGAMNDAILRTLGRCETEFAGAYGDLVRGFVPGADYPMIFIRDTSTLLRTASYYYPADRLGSAVEEFLRRQYDADTRSDEDGLAAGAGAISAVIAPDGHIDKATAVSDEETHLLHAAYVYYQIVGGQDWLRHEIRGRPAIERLNDALEWLYAHRLDGETGLIRRAHTTDWGDVKIEPADNPTDIDPAHDHWTASIYDQALTYRALHELAEMNRAVGDTARAEALLERADRLRERVQALLWQPDKGFFLTHLHLTPLEHPFDESAMVSIANAVAVRCGLADEQQAASIFKRLEEARKAAKASKPGVVLYPPYPQGTFAAERMRPGHYQNGALWDWWAGWQVLAEFEWGQAAMAREHLAQIARDWAAHSGQIFEWQTIGDNVGYGPDDYAGAAGTVGEAVIGGLFGVRLDRQGIELRPRLGDWPGFIRVYQPSAARYAAYRYTPTNDALYLDYGTAGPGPLSLAVLLPSRRPAHEVRLDDNPVEFAMERIGEDSYALVTDAPAGKHRVTLRLR